MQFKCPKDPSFRWQVQAESWMAGVEETHQILQENIIKVQKRQPKYAGGKDMTFAVGDTVWLSTRNLKTSRPSMKLDYKRTGLYTVSKIINKNAYKLDLWSPMRNHSILHVSLLDRYTPPVRGQLSSAAHPMIVEEIEEWEVDRILDSRRHYWNLQYLIQWAGYNHGTNQLGAGRTPWKHPRSGWLVSPRASGSATGVEV